MNMPPEDCRAHYVSSYHDDLRAIGWYLHGPWEEGAKHHGSRDFRVAVSCGDDQDEGW